MIEKEIALAPNLVGPSADFGCRDITRGARNVFSKIKASAEACSRNFAWLEANDGDLVPCFDTDIIYAAFFDYNGPKIDKSKEGNKNVGNKILHEALKNVEALEGPRVLRYYLNTVSRFSLPPGTVAEILELQQQIEHSLGRNARYIVDVVGDYTRAPSSFRTKRVTHARNFGSVLKTSIEEFTSAYSGLRLLEQLVFRSENFEDLLVAYSGGSVVERSLYDQALTQLLEHLNTRRRGYPRNNLCDAWNGASVANLFYSSQSGPNCILPVLVTNTSSVQTASGIFRSVVSDDAAPSLTPELVASSAFLTLQEGLMDTASIFTRETASFPVARENADNLARDVEDLLVLYHRQLRYLDGNQKVGKSRDESARIAFEFSKFSEEWSDVVWRHQDLRAIDQGDLALKLSGGALDWVLSGVERKRRGEFKSGLVNRIREVAASEGQLRYDLWEACLSFSKNEEFKISQKFLPGFHFYFSLDTASPLADMTNDNRYAESGIGGDLSFTFKTAPEKWRIGCGLPGADSSAIFAIDKTSRAGEEPRYRFLWSLQPDVEMAWEIAVKFLITSKVWSESGSFGAKALGSKEYALEKNNKRPLNWSDAQNLVSGGLAYLEMFGEGVTLLADCDDYDDEFAGGLIFSGDRLSSKSFVDTLTNITAATSNTNFKRDLLRDPILHVFNMIAEIS